MYPNNVPRGTIDLACLKYKYNYENIFLYIEYK